MLHSIQEAELVSLFGRELVDKALETGIDDSVYTIENMQVIGDVSDALLKHSDKPRLQRAVVAALDDATALLMCVFLIDEYQE